MSSPASRGEGPIKGDDRGWARDDHEVAAELAGAAGDLLTALRDREWSAEADLRDAGDQQAHEFLVRALAQRRPDDAVLSEEAADDPTRLEAERVWIIDPLDGTREFGEGRHDWAVHVALWERGELTAGAVALPGLRAVLSSGDRGQERSAPPAGARLRVAVSRTRPPALLAGLAELVPLELVPMGSAGYKAIAVVRGEVDAYVHAGGQYEWDSAAPVAVARSRGLHTSRVDGSPLLYNRPDPLLPDLLVCRSEVATVLLNALSALLVEQGS